MVLSKGSWRAYGKTAQAAAGTGDGNGVAGAGAGFFEGFVDGDASAEDWSDGVEGDFFRDAGDVGGFSDTVLLEGAVDCVA